MKNYLLASIALMASAGAVPAHAWSQLFTETGVGSFDHLQMWMAAPDGFRTSTGIDGFSAAGWGQTFNNGQLLIADGPASASVDFRLFFSGGRSDPFTLYFPAWGDGGLLESATVAWQGNGSQWAISDSSPWQPGVALTGLPVSEPSGLMLMGVAVLGVYLIRRRTGRPGHAH